MVFSPVKSPAELGIPLNRRVRRVRRMSGGQQAQLALTLALARRPKLLVLDEPLAMLDPLARFDFMDKVMTVASQRRAVRGPNAPEKATILSFVLDGHRPEDVGTALDKEASRSAPATTAHSRSCAATGWGRWSGRRWPCTTPAARPTSSSRPCAASWPAPDVTGSAAPSRRAKLVGRAAGPRCAAFSGSWSPRFLILHCRQRKIRYRMVEDVEHRARRPGVPSLAAAWGFGGAAP